VITELSGAVDLLDSTGKLKATFAVPASSGPSPRT